MLGDTGALQINIGNFDNGWSGVLKLITAKIRSTLITTTDKSGKQRKLMKLKGNLMKAWKRPIAKI